MCNGLRTRIARLHGCTPEQVFVGNGSDEVLALCVRAFVERDEAVGFFAPSYSLYPVLAAIEDVRTKPVELADDFSWRMPADYQAALFCLTQPNAPTSRPFPRSRIAAFCRRFTGVVLVDEAYGDFADEHFVDLALRRPNVVVARSFSKSYSLAGLRLGYAVGPAPLIAALHKIKDSYNVSYLTQQLAAAALSDQAWMRDHVGKIVATRERVARTLRERGWLVMDSATNFLFARPPARPASELFQTLRARHIFVRYFPAPSTAQYLRITIGTDAEMDALLAALT
jgi:histidinol-phosphate aminotransferase